MKIYSFFFVSAFFAILYPTLRAAEPDAPETHWSFQPVKKIIPPVGNAEQAELWTPVDSFIFDKLNENSLIFASRASASELIRRVYLDLLGFPPSPQQVKAFLADNSPDAYEKLVDEVLQSPHFGERQAHHWLDVVRFAESNGYEADGDRPHAWRYRDYVIRSFNEDLPYNQFLTEQVAGDELAILHPTDKERLLVAASMNRLGPVHLVSGNIDKEVARQEVLTEMVTGVGAAFLGLTMNCARCHDHKFDPISQKDYYQMEAFFANTEMKDVSFGDPAVLAEYDNKLKKLNQQIQPLRAAVKEIDNRYIPIIREQKLKKLEPKFQQAHQTEGSKRTPTEKALVLESLPLLKVTWDEIVAALSPEDAIKRKNLREQIYHLETQKPAHPGVIWTIQNQSTIPTTHILKRGEVHRKLEPVGPDFPEILRQAPAKNVRLTRADLAKWLTHSEHPLTARVYVNRIWKQYFGRGIVATPNDFGKQGIPPTHPELLDYLAQELIRNNWQARKIHRMILLSRTYQQSTRIDNPRGRAADPNNHLLWKMPVRRLDGEVLRDSMLGVAGQLNPQMFGNSVKIPLEPEVYDLLFTEGEPDGLWLVTPDARQHQRRSMYLFAKRNVRLPLFEAFDQPDRISPCGQRAMSTHAPQALILLNGPWTQANSKAIAKAVMQELPTETWRERLEQIVWRIYGRPTRTEEMKLFEQFIQQQLIILRKAPGVRPDNEIDQQALQDFCKALLNSNEFIYIN
ncbi:MAG: DUF1549 and DUF1553 domain-containing protein [Zavarzinella sp.]